MRRARQCRFLSDFGRAVVAELNRVRVIADVAHSGWRTSKEVAEASSKPVVASHTGCAAVNEHIRCKPDEVIRAIVDSGGFIGICCIPEFLGGSKDIRALFDHIDYVAKRFGVDHVAIGTDAAYTSRQMAVEQKGLAPAPGASPLGVFLARRGPGWANRRESPAESFLDQLAAVYRRPCPTR